MFQFTGVLALVWLGGDWGNLSLVAMDRDSTAMMLAPSAEEVVGDLILPYSGPIHLQVEADAIIVDVGGNVGAFALEFDEVVETRPRDIVGLGVLGYDDITATLTVDVSDELSIRLLIGPRSETVEQTDQGPILHDEIDCPDGKKCCSCTGENGGSAQAVCGQDERPVCNCSIKPCCLATCIKIKTTVEIIEFLDLSQP